MKWETEKQKEAETTDTTPTEGTRFSAKGYNPIAEKEVENVILKDETNKKLPTSRKEAFDYIPANGVSFYNESIDSNIRISRNTVKHTSLHNNTDRYAIFAGIEEIINNAVKIGNILVSDDEIGHTHSVNVMYVPLNVNGRQYSARMIVKELENKGAVLEELSLYNVSIHKEKGSEVQPLNASNEVGGITSKPISVYKVKDLIHNTQEIDKKILNLDEVTRFRFTQEEQGIIDKAKADGTYMRAFHIANAGSLLEEYGIKGKFMVGDFTFARTHTDNEDHNLGVKEWVDVINNLNNPLAITSYKGLANQYRIYTYATINGKNICVGVNVSLQDGVINLSNIISAYGRDVNALLGKEKVNLLYPATIEELKRRISQVSTAHNSLLNAPSTASEDKYTDNISDVKEEEGVSFRKVEDKKLIAELEASLCT